MAITLKQIDDKINTFSTNKVALQKLGHEIAMLIFRHAAPSSLPDCDGTADVTRALKLAKQMPKSWQPQIVEWFKTYSPVRIVIKNDKCGLDPDYKALPKADKAAAWKLDLANENPFYELEEPDVKTMVYDLAAIIKMAQQLPDRINKLVDGKVDGKSIKPTDIAAAKAVAAMLSSINLDSAKQLIEKPASNDQTPNNNKGSEQTAGEQSLSETLGVELKNVA